MGTRSVTKRRLTFGTAPGVTCIRDSLRAPLMFTAASAGFLEALMLIGTRKLTYRDDDRDVVVEVRISAPEYEDRAWSCLCEIDWPNGTDSFRGYGADQIQAIFLSLQRIGAKLYFSDYHKTGRLFWERPNSGYGFPMAINGRDLLVGDDKRFGG